MSAFKIRCAFARDANVDLPELVAAVDEYTLDTHNTALDAEFTAMPAFYTEPVRSMGGVVRELVICIDETVLRGLFEMPTTNAGRVVVLRSAP